MTKTNTRFMILGYPRSGSNLLYSCLQEHPDVICFNELFNSTRQIVWGYPELDAKYRNDLEMVAFRNANPIRFLEQFVWNRDVPAKGFKLFYGHQLNVKYLKHVWAYLHSLEDLRIIHLVRENALKSLASLERARQTKAWVQLNDSQPDTATITLKPGACEKYFKEYAHHREKYGRMFGEHPMLPLSFEEMVADIQGTMDSVFEFLGIPTQPAKPRTKRQRKLPIHKAVENYAGLKHHFQKTEWAAYFTE